MSYSIVDHLEKSGSDLGLVDVEVFRKYFAKLRSRNMFYNYVKYNAILYLRKKHKLKLQHVSDIVYNKAYDGSTNYMLYEYVPPHRMLEECKDWLKWIEDGLYPTAVHIKKYKMVERKGKLTPTCNSYAKLKLIKIESDEDGKITNKKQLVKEYL